MFQDIEPQIQSWTALGSGRYYHNKSWVDVDKNRENCYHIQTLFTPQSERGQGNATTILQRLADLADAQNATLVLKAASFDPNALNNTELINLYSRHGFIVVDSENNWMEREPHGN